MPSLPLANQGALKLGKGPHDRQHQVGHRRVLAGEHQAFLQELDAHTALGQLLHQAAQIIEVSCQAIHAVHHHGVAFANETEHGLQLGTLGVLAEALSVNSLPTSTCSSWRSGFWSKLLTRT